LFVFLSVRFRMVYVYVSLCSSDSIRGIKSPWIDEYSRQRYLLNWQNGLKHWRCNVNWCRY